MGCGRGAAALGVGVGTLRGYRDCGCTGGGSSGRPGCTEGGAEISGTPQGLQGSPISAPPRPTEPGAAVPRPTLTRSSPRRTGLCRSCSPCRQGRLHHRPHRGRHRGRGGCAVRRGAAPHPERP
ncbi:hypothetical protein Nmel_018857 [Mimus melanotis]